MVSRKSERLLGRLFKHDVGGTLNVSQASLNSDSHIDVDIIGVSDLDLPNKDFDSMKDISEGDMNNLENPSELGIFEEFVGVVEAVNERLAADYSLGTVEEEIKYLRNFEHDLISSDHSNQKGPEYHVEKVSNLAEAVSDYVDNSCEISESPNLSIDDVFETFEEYGNVEYNGAEGSEVVGDGALCAVANTIALNAVDHGEEPELYAEVEEDEIEEVETKYEINIWDDGEGLPDDYDPEEIFEREVGDNSGLGLYLAREITEGFGGSLEYSEENAEREDGFGLKWTLAKPGSNLGKSRTDDSADYFAD